jgi:NAD(P)-dependent dehydrogenase (short-subunit alcohol dehydrogenase family)
VNQPGPHGCAVVSGAASGIGQAIASRLLADGWRVVGLDKAPAEQSSAHFRSVAVDLTDFNRLKTVMDELDGVSAVVHAAGFMRTAPLGALDPEDGAAMWRLHVEAASVIANSLLPRMTGGGRMVLIGSRVASGAAGRSQYAAVKAALVGMARSWAAELAERHHRQCCCPRCDGNTDADGPRACRDTAEQAADWSFYPPRRSGGAHRILAQLRGGRHYRPANRDLRRRFYLKKKMGP